MQNSPLPLSSRLEKYRLTPLLPVLLQPVRIKQSLSVDNPDNGNPDHLSPFASVLSTSSWVRVLPSSRNRRLQYLTQDDRSDGCVEEPLHTNPLKMLENNHTPQLDRFVLALSRMDSNNASW